MKAIDLTLRIVFYYEHDRWIAHCLEFDVIGDGESKEDALECLEKAITLQIQASVEHDNPQNLFSPADGCYFQMFAQGKHKAVGRLQIHVDGLDLDEYEAREYSDEEREAQAT